MLSEGLLSTALFHGLDNHVLAANLLTLVTLALSAFAAHLLFRELTGSTWGAVVGAVYFAFNAYTFSQLPRTQLITLQWFLLGLFCLHRYFAGGKRAYLAGFALFSALQGLACFYYLIFYLVALTIFFPGFFWAFPERRNKRSIAWIGASALSVGIVLALVTLPYLSLYRLYAFTSPTDSYDLSGYFVPHSETLLYGFMGPEYALVDNFLGYVSLLIAAFGIMALFRGAKAPPERKMGLAYLAVALIGFALSAGPELRFGGLELGAGPYALLQKLGPFQNLRTPDRFSLLVKLGVGLLIAHGAATLLAKRTTRVGALGCAALCAVLLAEQWSPRRTEGREVPSGKTLPDVYRWLRAHPDTSPIAELPVRPFRKMRFVAHDAYYATFHERRILFNKPSFYPPAMELLQAELVSFPSRSSLTLLRALGVEQLVVHPKRWDQELKRIKSTELARRSEARLETTFPDRDSPLWNRYQLGGEQIYRLRPMEEEGKPRSCDCREISRDGLRVDSNGPGDARDAIDGDPNTKWFTGSAQVKGDFFEVAFDEPRRPMRIELEMAFPWSEFPRNVEVNGFLGDRGFRLEQIEDVWHKVALVRQLVADPNGARLRIDLVPETVDRIRLFVSRAEPRERRWSIPELYIYVLENESTSDWPQKVEQE